MLLHEVILITAKKFQMLTKAREFSLHFHVKYAYQFSRCARGVFATAFQEYQNTLVYFILLWMRQVER